MVGPSRSTRTVIAKRHLFDFRDVIIVLSFNTLAGIVFKEASVIARPVATDITLDRLHIDGSRAQSGKQENLLH